jgi:hypothetical protein
MLEALVSSNVQRTPQNEGQPAACCVQQGPQQLPGCLPGNVLSCTRCTSKVVLALQARRTAGVRKVLYRAVSCRAVCAVRMLLGKLMADMLDHHLVTLSCGTSAPLTFVPFVFPSPPPYDRSWHTPEGTITKYPAVSLDLLGDSAHGIYEWADGTS